MTAGVIALLAALGGGTWVYTKLQNKTGYGNSKSALTGAVVVAVLLFVVLFTILHMVTKK